MNLKTFLERTTPKYQTEVSFKAKELSIFSNKRFLLPLLLHLRTLRIDLEQCSTTLRVALSLRITFAML